MAVNAPGSRKMRVRKTAIPVLVKATRKGRQRKENVEVFPVAVAKQSVDPLTGAAHSAIDLEGYTLDLALQIARPVVETLEPVIKFIVGSPFGIAQAGRQLARELPQPSRENVWRRSELRAA